MKQRILNIKKFLLDNKWLLAVILIIGMLAFSKMWSWSFRMLTNNREAVNNLLEEDSSEEQFDVLKIPAEISNIWTNGHFNQER